MKQVLVFALSGLLLAGCFSKPQDKGDSMTAKPEADTQTGQDSQAPEQPQPDEEQKSAADRNDELYELKNSLNNAIDQSIQEDIREAVSEGVETRQ